MFTATYNKIVNAFLTWIEKLQAKHLQRRRDSAWAELKADALDQYDMVDQKTEWQIASTLLSNQIKSLRAEADIVGGKDVISSKVKQAFAITVKLIRHIAIELREVICIQPLTGPVGLTYVLKYSGDPKSRFQSVQEGELPKLRLEVVSNAVEARSLKMQARWALEALDDLVAVHDLDLEFELATVMAYEIYSEIVAYELTKMRQAAEFNTNHTVDPLNVHANTELVIEINRIANKIGENSLRGCGNFIITTPTLAGIIMTSPAFVKGIADSTVIEPNYSYPLQYVGILNGSIKVYTSSVMQAPEIIIGYKGGSGEVDGGLIYAPYVPLLSSGVQIDPMTFTPIQGFLTRFGTHLVTYGDAPKSPYFGVIKVQTAEVGTQIELPVDFPGHSD